MRSHRPAWRRFVQGLAAIGLDRRPQRADRVSLGEGHADDIRRYAAELVALAPDVILAPGSATVGPLLQATRTVPIVFTIVLDPVGAGFVDSLARPGGNATGFTQFEYSMSGKWLELLKEIAPGVTRAAVLRDPHHPRRDRPVRRHPVRGAVARGGGQPGQRARRGEIERAVTAFARSRQWRPDRDGEPSTSGHRNLIVALAARHKLPAIYFERFFVAGGGLISYGPDLSISTGARPAMSIASSRARSRPTCRCRRRPSTSW